MTKQQFTRLAKAARELSAALSDCERRMANPDGPPCGGACESCKTMTSIRRGMTIMSAGLFAIPVATAAKVARIRAKEGSPEFIAFWNAYPKSCPRRENRKKCAAHWAAAGLDSEAKEIREHLEHKRKSDQWLADDGKFIPAPLVYLHVEGWREDWRATDAAPLAPLDRAEAVALERKLADLRAVERGEEETDEEAAERFETICRHIRATPFAAIMPAIEKELEAVRSRFRLPPQLHTPHS